MRSLWLLPALAVAAACGGSKQFHETISGIGGACTANGGCRSPLVCDASLTCQPGHAVALDGDCGVSADCEPGLYCARGTCAPAGDGQTGAICSSTAECRSELVCAFVGLGGTCHAGGAGDIGDRCGDTIDCVPALVCDPKTGECAVDYSEPSGVACQLDAECEPEVGYVCLPDPGDPGRKVCSGLGPDGAPVPIWPGVACPGEVEGSFRVLFDADNTRADFFRLPFPNDIRIDSDGTVDLTGFPRPPRASVPVDLMSAYVRAIQDEQRGFGPNQTVFLRTSRRPHFCRGECPVDRPDCNDGCMGQGEPRPSIYAVDLGHADWPDYATCVAIADENPCRTTDGCSWRDGACTWTRNFTGYLWQASTGDTRYVCGPWIAITPTFTSPWQPGHTYAVFLHRDIMGARRCSGGANGGNPCADNDDCPGGTCAEPEPQTQDSDFVAMLAAGTPGGGLDRAWSAYQPLRDWLCPDPPDCAGAPTYTGGADPRLGQTIEAGHLGAAAVFTVRDPTETLFALGDAVDAVSSFAVTSVDCSDPTVEPCFDTTGQPFLEIQGTVELPSFQSGAPPYLNPGDGAVTNPPVQAGAVAVRFSMSVPAGGGPSEDWPVVLYAHGTGGDYQSHLRDGTAELLARAATPAAVIGIDQVAHGARKGDTPLSSDVVFFNFQNPQGARGNVLQSAADQLGLAAAIDAIEAGVTLPQSQTLDASRVGFLGHSQGSTSGALAMARAPTVGVTALSGAGGGLLATLGGKTSPYHLPTLVKLVLADPAVGETWMHPALSLIQGYLEDADPVNYGSHVTVAPLPGSVAKHALVVIGIDDTFTPNPTSRHLARRMRAQFVDDDETAFVGPGETAEPPVAGNRASGTLTVAATVHQPATGRDGHFVLFDLAKAAERVETFFAEFFADDTAPPTVVP